MDLSSATKITPILIALWIIYQLLDKFVFSKPRKSNDDLSSQLSIIQNNHLAHIADDLKDVKGSMKDISKEQISQGNRLISLETKMQFIQKVSNPSP